MKKNQKSVRKFVASSATRRTRRQTLRSALPELLESRTLMSTYCVTDTNDSGAGSLRAAITSVDGDSSPDTIKFAIPGGGIQTISLQSALPAVTNTVTIDGTTQTGYSGTPLIELNGMYANGAGLDFEAGSSGSKVLGLTIDSFSGAGIVLNSGNVTVANNFIGTDPTGSYAEANNDGVDITSNDNLLNDNLISGNNYNGVSVSGDGNTLTGNLIGPDVTGTQDIGNSVDGGIADSGGVYVINATNTTIGGTTAAARNVISGNEEGGVVFVDDSGSGNVLEGNYIGVDATGEAAMGNYDAGVDLGTTDSDPVSGVSILDNVISANFYSGIYLNAATNNTIQGNLIGTDAAGHETLESWSNIYTVFGNEADGITIDAGSTGNLIGGTSASARNVIAGNYANGIDVVNQSSNQVEGNFIGTDISGQTSAANIGDGILVAAGQLDIGGTQAGAGNVISGNDGAGVDLEGGTSVVYGNLIGLAADGSTSLGNGGDGVRINNSSGNVIGGVSAGEANVIADNGVLGSGRGVNVVSGVKNDIEGNSIYGNVTLGIDLGSDGVTANDSEGHSGPNNYQDFPVLNSLTFTATTVTLNGMLANAAAGTQYTIDLYNNPADDPSGHGQGQTFVGSELVTIGSGGSFTATFTVSQLPSGISWSATATNEQPGNQLGNTSEFSADYDSTAAVQKQDALVQLSSSQNPATFGQSVTFTAMVTASGAQPTGSVTFYDNGNALGTVNLSGDSATFTTSSLGVATHNISISYSGDSNYNQGSASLSETVNTVATATALSVNPTTSLYGQNVTLTATVTPSTAMNGVAATGMVTFLDGTSVIGSAPLSNGVASITVNTLGIGTHNLTAQYGGDSNFAGSAGTASESVQVQSSTALSVSPPSSTLGQTVTLTATVTPSINGVFPSGTVTFLSGGTTLGTASLNASGVATLNVSSLPVGTDSLVAQYGGNANFLPSSGTASETVNKAGTGTSLVATPAMSTFGQTVTLTATVTPSSSTDTPSGTISFMDGSNSLGIATLVNGVASIQVSTLAVGGHTITATYGGDSNFTGSSAMASESVGQAASNTALAVSTSTSTLGQAITLTATVTPTINGVFPSGTVTFTSGGTTLGTASLNASGVATLSVNALPVGTDSLLAQYSGDTNFLASSGSNSETVNKAATSTSLSETPSSTTPGQTVTFTATVMPSISGYVASGSVTFWDGSNSLGSVTLNSSDVATLQVSTLALGSHTITAVYGGDGNFTGSTSNPVTETVNPAPSSISGTVTNDLTGNGFSSDDTALAGWTVNLYLNGATTPIATAVTATGGTYSFANLAPGSYSVQEVLKAGWTETGGSAGYSLTAISGNSFSGVNFDNFQNVTLGGTVYKDLTGNGFSSDDTPMSGVTVDLFVNGGTTPVATATSASNGTYSFANLGPGSYSVQEVVPAGYTLTGGMNGYSLTPNSGQSVSTDNFDNYLTPVPPPPPPPTGSISGYVFCDDNLDGIFDLTTWDGNVVSESGEAGATVTLTGTTTAGASVNLTTTSVTGGYYTFGGLSAGTYTVSLTGFSPNHQAELSHGSVNPTYSTKVTLAAGQALTGPAEGQYGAAGTTSGLDFAEIAPGGLEGFVWDDTNNDGNIDYNEAGIVNVTIQLNGVTYNGVKVSQTTVTDNDGEYVFTNLQPGSYTLTEVTPGGFTDGKDSVGSLGGAEYFSSNCGSTSGCSTGSTNCGSNCGNSSCGQTNCGSNCSNSSCGNCCYNDCYSNCGYDCFTNYSTNCYNSNCGSNNCGNCGGNSQNCNSQCNCGWTSGSNTGQNVFSGIQIGGCENVGVGYNFGEHSQALTGSTGCCGNNCQPTNTASLAFWHNSQGQALICSLNGGPNATALGNWLASMFPNMYGSAAKVDFAGMTNTQIAAFYNSNDFNVTGIKLNAAVLSAALSSYVTNSTWAGGTYAAKYGFTVSAQGVGYDTVNIGSDGVAFGMANNSTVTILQALDATDQQAVDGTLYNGNTTLCADAYTIYAAIAQNGLST